jgi:hypothetical protein
MVADFIALLFGLAASSIGNMPVSKLMALAWTSLGERLHIDDYWQRMSVLRACQRAESEKTREFINISTWFNYYFEGMSSRYPPPNHISNKSEGVGLDNCDLIY